jgi:beta-lactamase superfamily II metal-dependent hydrolase
MPFLADTGDDVNENSIVAMVQFGRFRELFMGDAGEASGSRYASTAPFVAAVHPRIAVVSIGRHNTFGHPAPATIQAWDAAGVDVLRTDQCGAISLRDGSRQRCFDAPHRNQRLVSPANGRESGSGSRIGRPPKPRACDSRVF